MELNEPLGTQPSPKPRRWIGLIVGAGTASIAVLGLGFFLATADPRGGEPYAVATLPPLATPGPTTNPTPSRRAIDPIQTGSVPRGTPPDPGTMENGVKVFRSSPPTTGTQAEPSKDGPLIIDVSKVLDDPLNRRKSLPEASRPNAPTVTGAAQPRIAIFVSGMGLSQAATKAAIDSMPAAVTLAFVPYDATNAVAAAKAKGHEILLQIPMQSGSAAAPGPHALRPGEPATALAEDLNWLMSRFDGYDGVTNLLGAPVTADTPTMTAILKAVRGRGLFYLDDGLSKRSVALNLASGLDLSAVQADLVLDATADSAAVRANLEALVAIAKRKGSAIGMASGLPDHMPEIARFATALGAQGIALVPVSALVAKGAAIAANR